jgi:ABC-type glycerol-3-phosphate transport system substrate-binding protein
MAVISEKSTKKDLAALFLRFCASEEVGTIISKSMQTGSPFAVGVNRDSEYIYLKATSKITENPYFKQLISANQGYRERLSIPGMFPSEGDVFVTKVYDAKITTYDENLNRTGTDSLYENAAKQTVERIYQNAKENVEKGLIVGGKEGWRPIF